jgi:hypothetical protein
MTVRDKATLKGYFSIGEFPSEANYADLIDTLFEFDPNNILSFSYIVTVTGGQATTPKFTFGAGAPAAVVDWGDGTAQSAFTSGMELNHTYTNAGTYTVKLIAPNQATYLTQIDINTDKVVSILTPIQQFPNLISFDGHSNYAWVQDLNAWIVMPNLVTLKLNDEASGLIGCPDFSRAVALQDYRLTYADLPQAAVDLHLSRLVAVMGSLTYHWPSIDLSGNDAPSPSGDANAGTLIAAGWTVTVDSAPTFGSGEVGAINTTTIDVTLSEAIQGTNYGSGWTFKINSVTKSIVSATRQTNTAHVYFVISAVVANGDTVTCEYAAASGNIKNMAGNPLANVSAQTLTNNVAAPGVVVINIDFSTNDLSQFDSVVGSNLSVTDAAAQAGTNHGLSVLINSTSPSYGIKAFTQTPIVRYRHYFNPHSITIPSGHNYGIFAIHFASDDLSSHYLCYDNTNGYRLKTFAQTDALDYGPYQAPVNITDGEHWVEVEIVKATTNVSSDGTYQWWLDGMDQGITTGIDNYNIMTDYPWTIRWGAVEDIVAGTAGTFYLDELIVNNDGSFIGPVGGSPPVGSVYYVDQVNGSDSYNGLFQTHSGSAGPWKTVAKVNAFQASLLPGDQVLFKCGCTWAERLDLYTVGTAAAPITYSKYGSGANPKLDGTGIDSNGGNNYMLQIGGNYNIFENFEILFPTGRGVRIYHGLTNYTTGGSNNTLSYLTVHDTWVHGIMTDAGDGNIYDHCTVYNACLSNHPYPGSGGWGGAIAWYGTHQTVRYCTSYHNWCEGLIGMETSYGDVYGNRVWDCWANGILLDQVQYYNVHDNFVYYTTNTDYWRNGSFPQNGITTDNENVNGGLSMSRYNKIYNNIVVNCYTGFKFANYTAHGIFNAALQDTYVVNNTFINYHGWPGISIGAVLGTGVQGGNYIRDNVDISSDPGELDSGPSGITLSNNNWSSTPDSNMTGSGDVVGDPLLVNPTQTIEEDQIAHPLDPTAYRLTSSSPGRGAGVAVSFVADDYWGTARSDPPDMGAHEY